MRIHRFRMHCVVMAVALASTLALAVTGGGGTALGATTTLTVLSGDVSVRHLDDGVFAAAADGQIVTAGDTIRTGANAQAVITYFEGSTVTIEPNTILVVNAAEVRGGGTIVLMTQLVGRTWHVVTKLVNRQSRYDVKTPASTASVRGTRFLVDSISARTTITTQEGRVVAAVPSGRDVIEVPVVAGTTQTQERGAAPSPARPTATSTPMTAPVVSSRGAAVTMPAGGEPSYGPTASRVDIGRGGIPWLAARHDGDRVTQDGGERGQQPLEPSTKHDKTSFERYDAETVDIRHAHVDGGARQRVTTSATKEHGDGDRERRD